MSEKLTPFQNWWVKQQYKNSYADSIMGACEAAWNAALPHDAEVARKARADALREATNHAPWSDGKCLCGVIYSLQPSREPFGDYAKHLLSLADTAATQTTEDKS